ncbi:unnamed protein product, partial [Brenthis ino]
MIVLVFMSVLFYHTTSYKYFDNSPYYEGLRQTDELYLNESFFPALRGYHVNAKVITEFGYPWIARVIHSKENNVPYLCTASCIDKMIFITAARCVYLLKITYTSIIYQNQRLKPKAFILPSNPTKQFYDDIGFIIVHDDLIGTWETIDVYSEKRTDNAFKWLEDMEFEEYEHRIVGYTSAKKSKSVSVWHKKYELTELDVVANIQICSDILPFDNLIVGFEVPCYHSCSSIKFIEKDELCKNYHGVEGGALLNLKSKQLFGIATWGAYYTKYELPVGFAVPNSDNYFEDLTCAKKIRDNNKTSVSEGFYQSLCN